MTSRVLRALSAFTLFVGAVSLLPGSARADASRSETHPVEVAIDQVSPQIPNFTDTSKTMTFGGTLRNTGSSALRNLHLEIQRTAVKNRAQMGSADGQGDYYVTTKSSVKLPAELAANASFTWKLTPTETELFGSSKPNPGVYAIDFDVFDSDGIFVGGQRTYTVWNPAKLKNSQHARIALMWPVVGEPGLTGQKKTDSSGLPILTDQSAAQQFAPNGRLSRILDDPAGLQVVNWLVDPDLLYTADQLRGGYFYPDPQNNGKLTGAQGLDAKTWHDHANDLLSQSRNCWNLLYGDPDLNTLSHAKAGKDGKAGGDLLKAAFSVQSPATTGCQQGGPTIAWPSDGQADSTTLAAIAGAKPSNLVPLLGSNEVSVWPSAHASFPNSPSTVVYDNYLSALFAPSAGGSADVLAGQMWLAQTALADKDNSSRVMVVTPPRNFDPGPQLLNAIKASSTLPPAEQWFSLESLDKVLRTPATPEKASAALTKIGTSNLSNGVVEAASDSQKLYHALHAIMPGHEYDPDVPFRPVATWWRNQSGVQAYSKAVYTTVVNDHGLVSFGTQTPPLTMSGKSGTVPVSINNRTNAEIRVYLGTHTSHNLQLKVAQSQGAKIVEPGLSATIRIPVRGEGNGVDVNLYATLYTCPQVTTDCAYYPTDLSMPLDVRPGQTRVTVTVSRIGIIALALMIGSGMLLVLLIGLRVYRAKRAHHAPVQDTMAS